MTDTINYVVNFEVLTQGAISLNHAYVYRYGGKVCAIAIEMKTKRADIFTTGCDENNCPTIALEANEDSVNLREGVARDTPTEISFPDFKGWTVFAANVSKYSVYVCLVNPE